jgi:cytochrome c6
MIRLTLPSGLLCLALAAGSVAASCASAQDVVSAEDILQGGVQYHRTCAQCHGRNMVNSGVTVYDLRRFPMEDPTRFFNSVTNGKGNMPSFKDALTQEQIKLLWAYVGSRSKPL